MKTRFLLLLVILVNSLAFGQSKLNVTITQPTCQAARGHNYSGIDIGNGIITITAFGGTAPYTYSISGTRTTSRTQVNGYFPQLYLGDYAFTIKDAAGLQKDTSITLVATNAIPNFPKPITTQASNCNSNDGTITFKDSIGTPPYVYSIDGGATYSSSKVFNNLPMGQYVCCVKDANACVSFVWSIPIVAKNTCSINFYISGQTACGADSDPLWFSGYVTPSKDYSAVFISYDSINFKRPGKSDPNGSIDDSIANLAPGTYYVYAKDTISNTTSKYAFVIGKSCKLYITSVGIDASCGGSDGALTVSVSNGIAPFSYTIDGIHFQPSNIITGLPSGGYTILVVDATGATSVAFGTVYNKCPVVSATVLNYSCAKGGTINAHGIKGVNPYQFSIDGVHFQNDSVFTRLGAGKYNVTLKDVNGFKDSTKVSILDSCIQMTLTATDETCGAHNGSILAIATGGTGSIGGNNFYWYQIFNSAGSGYTLSSAQARFTNLSAGIYIVVVHDLYNFTDTAFITIKNTSPTIYLGNDTTLCAGQKLILSPNIAGATYVWQDGTTASNYTVSQAGRYWVKATSNNCTVIDTINVSYLNLVKIFTTADTIACIGGSIVLNAGHTGATFLWDDGSINQSRTVNADGKYWVKVISSGCSVSDTITARFVLAPIIVFPSDTSFCNTQQLILNAGNINATYLWSNGTIGSTLVVTKAGVYIVAATANGCTSYDTIKVAIKPNPHIALGNDTTLCAGQIITLNATDKNANSNATYIWQDGSKLPLYSVNKQGSYLVKVAANGCDTTGKITITYTAKPVISIGADTTLCNTQQLVLDASYPKSSYLWQDGSAKPNFTVTQAGIYKVDVTNYCGTVSDSIAVQYESCDCMFYIPSAFSPNGDGKNDIFKPTYQCLFTNYKLNIYSRFGKIIYTSSNADNGWDGLINGEQQPAGVYVWEISYLDTFTNKAIKKNGTMVLVR